MKLKIACFMLIASIAAFGQGRGSGRPAGAGMGGGMGHSTMGSNASANHDASQMKQHTGSEMGKQSPDTILTRNTKLNSNLEKLLPQGTTAQQACSGFKNLGQCVAAIHVSNNLGIPFADLKAKVTGDGAEKLGKAIQDLKPAANAKAEEKKAKQQAESDMDQQNG